MLMLMLKIIGALVIGILGIYVLVWLISLIIWIATLIVICFSK